MYLTGPEVLDRVLIPGPRFERRYGVYVIKSIACENSQRFEFLIGF